MENEFEERLLSARTLRDDDTEVSLRPKTFEGYIGQEKVKENLSTVLETQNPRKETKQPARRKRRLFAKQIFCVFGRSKFLKIQKTFSKKFFGGVQG